MKDTLIVSFNLNTHPRTQSNETKEPLVELVNSENFIYDIMLQLYFDMFMMMPKKSVR